MKKIILLASIFIGTALINTNSINAQVKVTDGPALNSDKNNNMNRMLGGDENSFYCYRIRSKGKGTSFYVEKYSKATMKLEFSKEISMGEDIAETKIEDVQYSKGNVYVFRRQYDKKADKMSLYYQTVSSTGTVDEKLNELFTVTTDHYEFIDFDVCSNPSQTKILIKACHKASKDDAYKTDFIVFDAAAKSKWVKRVNMKLRTGFDMSALLGAMFGISIDKEDAGYVGMFLDDQENIYYGYTAETKNSTKDERRYRLNLSTIEAKSQTPKNVELTFDEDYFVKDIEFMKNSNNEIVVGGFIKDVIERKGRDLVKIGIFSFKVSTVTNTVVSKAVFMFDAKVLTSLESSPRRSRYFKYKLDYIMPVGNEVYYIGEQYQEQMGTSGGSGMGGMGGGQRYWDYEYMDVIVAKLNAAGQFEWVKNTPLRNGMRLNQPHVFKQYIAVATSKNIYILANEHKKNMERYVKPDYEPADLKTVTGIHGSNFVCSAIALTNGDIKHTLVFENETYCFAPIQERNPQFLPPETTEIFVKGKDGEIYIYTEDRGKDRFSKLKFD